MPLTEKQLQQMAQQILARPMPHTTPTDLNADARYLRMLADDLTRGARLSLSASRLSELNQNALRLREIAERLDRTGEGD